MSAKEPTVVGIQIGASKEAIDAARGAVMDILTSGMEQETIRHALTLFGKVTSVDNAAVHDVQIRMTTDSAEVE